MTRTLRRDDLVYPELSYEIIGILIRVHNELGNSYQEKYYQRAIAAGLTKMGIGFQEQVPVELTFDGVPIGQYRVDFMIDDKMVLEVKAISRLTVKDFRQVDGYLRALGKELGILANFRTANLVFHRILNPRMKS